MERAMKKIAILSPLLIALPAFADGPHFHADLIGFQEVPSIATAGHGTFTGVTAGDWQSIDWQLTFANVLASPASQQLRAGAIGDFIVAMDAGYAYANVHTTISGGGEIRGQINPPK
jgi:hypothetical protein